jgi:CRISPR-associated protein Cas2
MIVITVANCPPKVRGDLSKWLFEISTGVFVGNLDARVREKLWERICGTLNGGRATMVYSTNGEQRLSFRTTGSVWEPVDFDGITIMRRPFPKKIETTKVNEIPTVKAKIIPRTKKINFEKVIVIDLETTGLNIDKDQIIEIGAIKYVDGEIINKFNTLIRTDYPISNEIKDLTGISEEMLLDSGIDEKEALLQLRDYIEKDYLIVCHNAKFDLSFLRNRFNKYQIDAISNKVLDTLLEARKQIINLANYKLRTIAEYYHLGYPEKHRALDDCFLTLQIYLKLKEKRDR